MSTSEVSRIHTLIENWAAAVRAHDIDAVLRHHHPDMLMFDVVGPIRLEGLEAYRRTWLEQFFPWHAGMGRFALKDLEVTAGEHVAFATALLDCAGTEKGQSVAFTLRLTVGLEKLEGEWIIVHEHHSEPLPYEAE